MPFRPTHPRPLKPPQKAQQEHCLEYLQLVPIHVQILDPSAARDAVRATLSRDQPPQVQVNQHDVQAVVVVCCLPGEETLVVQFPFQQLHYGIDAGNRDVLDGK